MSFPPLEFFVLGYSDSRTYRFYIILTYALSDPMVPFLLKHTLEIEFGLGQFKEVSSHETDTVHILI